MALLHIVDVSAYQGTTVPAVDAVFVKATEGSTYISSRFAAQWKSAGAQAQHRGAYHFARPEASSASSQADRFLDVVRPGRGESLWLDLEASGLNQAKTHAWAVAWADRIRDQAPGITYGIYMGSGYASNNTGKGLADEYPLWWYPQYPSAYQLAHVDVEALRIANRTAAIASRTPIAARTSRWPATVEPWLPSGVTFGRPRPEIWQFTDNWQGYDASVTALTLDQLAGGGQETPLEEDMPYGGQLQPGAGTRANISFPRGAMGAIGLVYDSPDVAQVRVAFHHKAGSGEVYTLKVGGPKSATDTWPAKTVQTFKTPADGDWVSLTRLDEGKDPVGWDMS